MSRVNTSELTNMFLETFYIYNTQEHPLTTLCVCMSIPRPTPQVNSPGYFLTLSALLKTFFCGINKGSKGQFWVVQKMLFSGYFGTVWIPKSAFWGYLVRARAQGHSRCPPNAKMKEKSLQFGYQFGTSFRKKCDRFLMDFSTPLLKPILKGLGSHLGSLLVVFSTILVDTMK